LRGAQSCVRLFGPCANLAVDLCRGASVSGNKGSGGPPPWKRSFGLRTTLEESRFSAAQREHNGSVGRPEALAPRVPSSSLPSGQQIIEKTTRTFGIRGKSRP